MESTGLSRIHHLSCTFFKYNYVLFITKLTLYSPRSVSANERFNFLNSDEVKITKDGVLESRCCYPKFKCVFVIFA